MFVRTSLKIKDHLAWKFLYFEIENSSAGFPRGSFSKEKRCDILVGPLESFEEREKPSERERKRSHSCIT